MNSLNQELISKPFPQPRIQIPFCNPLLSAVLNIEDKARSSLFAWRGQFSPQLIESLLAAYCDQDAPLLDPFMGSGTVLVEGARQGKAVYGVEVNPAAYLISCLYEFCSLSLDVRSRELNAAEELLDRAVGSDLPLFKHVDPKISRSLPSIAAAVENPRVRTLLEAVCVLSDSATETEKAVVYRQRLHDIRRIMKFLPRSGQPVRAFLGDARRLPIPDRSIGFVLSSPPYINVFNYHHNYRSAVEALGWLPLVVAKSEIGANRKFRQNRFLTVVQYCIDMSMAMAEMRRTGKDDLRAILILGRESNVHMTPFFNAEIVAAAATSLVGFRLEQRQERAFTNRFGQTIHEDLLHLEAHSSPLGEESLVTDARELGRDILLDARRRVPKDRLRYLDEAILLAPEVEPSPFLVPSMAQSPITK
jgi:hypothetical protein